MQTLCLIGGAWMSADSGAVFDVVNPATGGVVAQVPDMGEAETRRAIGAAWEAWPAWRDLPAGERANVIAKLGGLMRRDVDRLSRLMTAEQGKPIAESRGEIEYAASFLDWAAGECVRLTGEIIPATSSGKRILVLRRAVGVAAIITPWNFPSAMITRKLGPALACGCTCLIKPAEQTPLSAIAICELAAEAGVPAGVVNIVTGDAAAIGGALLSDERVRKLSFTGSTEVGKLLMRGAAEHVLRLSLELGGHAPFVVFDDADIERAVAGAMASKFRNAGQTCICPNRFYVQDGVYDAFVSRFAESMSSLVVGPGDRAGVQIGPMIDDAAVEKVERHIADAVAGGAKVRVGGHRVDVAGFADRFYAPTLIEGFTHGMLVAKEETFGPVAPVARFETEGEAIELANDSPYGLAAYVYTRDISRAVRVSEALEHGVVGVNDAAPSTAQAPFGGVKQSGLGREGGRYAMDEYSEYKYVSLGV